MRERERERERQRERERRQIRGTQETFHHSVRSNIKKVKITGAGPPDHALAATVLILAVDCRYSITAR
jgi:hypothetical protein